jgi:hypothetical protein
VTAELVDRYKIRVVAKFQLVSHSLRVVTEEKQLNLCQDIQCPGLRIEYYYTWPVQPMVYI